MEQAFLELIKNAPWAFVMVYIVRLFLANQKEERAQRVDDAKEAGGIQRAHELQLETSRRGRELEINNLWASTVKNMMATQDSNSQAIVTAIKDMRDDITQQYKNMGITKDLYDDAKRIISETRR